jgi:hypothetical protein
MAVKKQINWDLVELYVKAGSSQKKISESLYIHPNTLADRVKEKYGIDYSTFSSALLSEGEMLAEATAYQKAIKGHWPALHWLLQVRCGQKLPENINQISVNQNQIDQSHRIMELEHQIAELKANADKPQTE